MTQKNELRLALWRHVTAIHKSRGIRTEAIGDVVERIIAKHGGTLGVDSAGLAVSNIGAQLGDLIDWTLQDAPHLTTQGVQAPADPTKPRPKRLDKEALAALSPEEKLNYLHTGDPRGPISGL